VIGGGSNILAPDVGFRGVVMKICEIKASDKSLEIIDENREYMILNMKSATLKGHLINFAIKKDCSGVECLSGIPGTVGGGLKMNAGTLLGNLGDNILKIKILTSDGKTKEITKFKFNYRSLDYKDKTNEDIFLSTYIKLKKENEKNIEKNMNKIREYRNATQPIGAYSAGSVFLNPKNNSAGKIIDELNLKGEHIEDAYISEKHANFIVNKGNAKASDVIKLIELIKRKAKKEKNINLKEEIEII
jgi:UDP-N-acetylmuramate dehydrogenase